MFENMYLGQAMMMFFQIEDSFDMKMPENKEGCSEYRLEMIDALQGTDVQVDNLWEKLFEEKFAKSRILPI
jgi:hypothetical protein